MIFFSSSCVRTSATGCSLSDAQAFDLAETEADRGAIETPGGFIGKARRHGGTKARSEGGRMRREGSAELCSNFPLHLSLYAFITHFVPSWLRAFVPAFFQ